MGQPYVIIIFGKQEHAKPFEKKHALGIHSINGLNCKVLWCKNIKENIFL